MLATMEVVDVLDRSEGIGQLILGSDVYEEFNQAKQDLEENEEAQKLIHNFNKMKDQYEEVQRFGRYHPDYSSITKKIRSVKREMDMHECVARYKRAERNVQKLLDDISQSLAYSVSEQIKVPRNGMVFTDTGCSCGSGGGCGCS
ncbi:YlbF family regulator [Salimicrobium sp. PL1-032A]|uniref:YlbF family regulator n=1 Tax=Salimicrobium sp. PL1-032A TaxID=3095364 RepID=UPI00326093D2